jgi:hypothetical protein
MLSGLEVWKLDLPCLENFVKLIGVIQPEQLVGEEWAEWYRLTPAQRWEESEKLWQTYLALGGSLDP